MRMLADSQQFSHLEFDTYTEAIACAHDKRDQCSSATCRDYDGEKGTPDYETAHAMATAGWPEGRAKLETMAAAIVTPARVARPECVYDVTGDGGADIGRALSGQPECVFDWRDSDHMVESQNGPIVRIGFNPAVWHGIKLEAIMHRGSAVLALIDCLEAAGRRVELVIEKVNSEDDRSLNTFRITIPIKSADFQAQPDQIAFALIHPSMNRRVLFSLTAQCGLVGRAAARQALGGPTKYRPADYDVWIPRLEPDYETRIVPNFGSQADATQWVFAKLAEFGVTATPEAR